MSWKREGDRVSIEMNFDDWNMLLIVLGFATGAALEGQFPITSGRILGLVNRLNEGNPDFTPYEIAEKAPH
ncbi:MAG TPA: hypothetical protein VHZ74_10600 [Bryobacteraceae bacterium]|jgi:hypothetical protein|nr:hypothetical protein [Bryobacteraceae bacterium]